MENTLTQAEILDIVTCIGYYIIKNGGEISRAEDTSERVGLAYGMDAVHVFAIATSIVVSVEKGDVSLSQTRRIKNCVTDLNRVERFNALSRKICQTRMPYTEVVKEIRDIKNTKRYPLWVSVMAFAIIGGAFAVFFGGGVKESIAAFIIGIFLRFLMFFAEKLKAAPFFKNVSGAALTVFLTHVANGFAPGINEEIVNIGVLMNLVPGVLITNCIRDFVSTDYMAGAAKIFEAFLIAAAIALGVSVSVLWR